MVAEYTNPDGSIDLRSMPDDIKQQLIDKGLLSAEEALSGGKKRLFSAAHISDKCLKAIKSSDPELFSLVAPYIRDGKLDLNSLPLATQMRLLAKGAITPDQLRDAKREALRDIDRVDIYPDELTRLQKLDPRLYGSTQMFRNPDGTFDLLDMSNSQVKSLDDQGLISG